jgi:hypothetical protein
MAAAGVSVRGGGGGMIRAEAPGFTGITRWDVAAPPSLSRAEAEAGNGLKEAVPAAVIRPTEREEARATFSTGAAVAGSELAGAGAGGSSAGVIATAQSGHTGSASGCSLVLLAPHFGQM